MLLLLGGAKRKIKVVPTQNEYGDTIERRCNITLEDFWSMHVQALKQLVAAEEALEVAQQLMAIYE